MLQDLTGQFNLLKQEAMRPALRDVSLAAMQNTQAEDTDSLIHPGKAQGSPAFKSTQSMTARLKGLTQKTTLAEDELKKLSNTKVFFLDHQELGYAPNSLY